MELTERQKELVLLGLSFLEQNLDFMNEDRESESLGKISSEELHDIESIFENEVTTSIQMRTCPCGEVTPKDLCPKCKHLTFPFWSVHLSSGEQVGFSAAHTEKEAIGSLYKNPEFDKYESCTVKPVTPESWNLYLSTRKQPELKDET